MALFSISTSLRSLASFLPKLLVGLLGFTLWAGLVLAVFASPTGWQLVALLALVMSCLGCLLSVTLWVFFLAKHLSTHSVQMLDVNALAARKASAVPQAATRSSVPGDPLDEDLEDQVEEVMSEMFGGKTRHVAPNEDLVDRLF